MHGHHGALIANTQLKALRDRWMCLSGNPSYDLALREESEAVHYLLRADQGANIERNVGRD